MASQPGIRSLSSFNKRQPAEEPGRAALSLAEDLKSWQARLFFGTQTAAAIAIAITQAPRLEGSGLRVVRCLKRGRELRQIPIYESSNGRLSYLAIIVLFGIPGAVIAAPIATSRSGIGRRAIDYRTVTNAGRFIIVSTAAGLAYSFLGGQSRKPARR
jgi:hypothetical protein